MSGVPAAITTTGPAGGRIMPMWNEFAGLHVMRSATFLPIRQFGTQQNAKPHNLRLLFR